jgi:uncharacterized protein YukE
VKQAAQAARHSPRKTAGMLAIAVVVAAAIAAVAGYVPSAVTAAQAQYGPTNTAAPTISDTTPQTGQSLTASPGTWTGDAPIAFSYQWQRCNASGAACVAIAGATAQTYLVQSADQGNTLRVAVTGTNAAGSSTATSAATSAVTAGTGAVPIESVVLPNRLVIDQIRFVPRRISYSRTRTFTLTVRVREINSNRPVSGALVFARSTPIVTTTPPERATNANGQITFTISTESDFRRLLRPGYGLQFFVRARKGGENPLAGVSTRRLIQVSITR